MFTRVLALLPLALVVFAGSEANQCNTGSLSCCDSTQTLAQATPLLTSLGLLAAATSAGGLVGITCTPVTVIGTGTGCSATQQPVCCTGNTYNGVVNLGCSPFSITA